MSLDNEEKAVRALPLLDSYAKEATQLAEELLADKIHFDADADHFGFMAMCFLAEQVGYMEAVIKLVNLGLGKPSGLVARSMLEGMALLRWARGRPERSMRWRFQVWIKDYQTMTRKLAAGEPVDPQYKTRVENALKIHGDLFLTTKAKKRKAAGESLPQNRSVRSWYAPNSLKRICAQISATPLYETIYQPESERTHWGVASVVKSVNRHEGGFVYASSAISSDDATFLAVGFQSLLEVLQDVDEHLELGRDDDISDLRNRYVSELAGTQIP